MYTHIPNPSTNLNIPHSNINRNTISLDLPETLENAHIHTHSALSHACTLTHIHKSAHAHVYAGVATNIRER